MTAKTWMFSDLESVVKAGSAARLPVALLNRIAREAMAAFDAPKGAILPEVHLHKQENGATSVSATLHFDAIKLASGPPGVGVNIEQRDDRLTVRVGAQADTAALGYSFDFGWTEETPMALFPALFTCVLESIRIGKVLK
jgi:hypothetical protein